MDPARDGPEKTERYVSYKKRIAALAVAVVIVVTAFSVYYTVANRPSGENTLTVYTYSSFMSYGLNNTTAKNTVFQSFEHQYGVKVNVRYIQSGLLQSLESKSSSRPDVVIGLTNINGIQAVENHLLLKYTPPGEGYVNTTLLSEMGSVAQYLVPYEYSYLGIDFNKTFVKNESFTPTFSDLLKPSNASNLLLQNPISSATGEEFLLWQIAYYTYILHENWTSWWQAIKPYTNQHIFTDWASSFSSFGTGAGTDLLVSYLTDPAYNQVMGYGNGTGSTVAYSNGTAYGWRTIYGVGIVNGSANIGIAKEFVNYFLSPTVQNLIPENEWMYPANSTISLPASFGLIVNPGLIHPLNQYIDATAISRNLSTWENEWLTIM